MIKDLQSTNKIKLRKNQAIGSRGRLHNWISKQTNGDQPKMYDQEQINQARSTKMQEQGTGNQARSTKMQEQGTGNQAHRVQGATPST